MTDGTSLSLPGLRAVTAARGRTSHVVEPVSPPILPEVSDETLLDRGPSESDL